MAHGAISTAAINILFEKLCPLSKLLAEVPFELYIKGLGLILYSFVIALQKLHRFVKQFLSNLNNTY